MSSVTKIEDLAAEAIRNGKAEMPDRGGAFASKMLAAIAERAADSAIQFGFDPGTGDMTVLVSLSDDGKVLDIKRLTHRDIMLDPAEWLEEYRADLARRLDNEFFANVHQMFGPPAPTTWPPKPSRSRTALINLKDAM